MNDLTGENILPTLLVGWLPIAVKTCLILSCLLQHSSLHTDKIYDEIK